MIGTVDGDGVQAAVEFGQRLEIKRVLSINVTVDIKKVTKIFD